MANLKSKGIRICYSAFTGYVPKKPVRNRRTRRPPKLLTNAVGIQSTANIIIVITYGGLRPTAGILVTMVRQIQLNWGARRNVCLLAERGEDHCTDSICHSIRGVLSNGWTSGNIYLYLQARTYNARPREDASILTPNFSMIWGTPPI